MSTILIAALTISAIAYLPTTFLIARPMMQRGYIGWGFLTGLIVLIIGFLLSNYAMAFSQYKTFSKNGPCGICYEWGFVPVLMLWGGWVLGTIVYLINNIVAGIRLHSNESGNLMKWPGFLGYWVLASILVVGIIFVSEQIWLLKKHNEVIERISGVTTHITGGDELVEAASLPIVQPLLLPLSSSYVEENGVQFSPDGNWLFLKAHDDLEIWNAVKLEQHYSFKDLKYSDGLFVISPDSKFVALKIEETLSLYEIATMKLVWQTPSVWGNIWEIRFSESGDQLIFIWGKTLFRINAATGEVIQETEIPFLKDGYNFILNHDGNYLAGYHEGEIYFFDGLTGKQLYSGNKCSKGLLTFLPNNDLFCWQYQPEKDQLYIWNVSGTLIKNIEFPPSHWPGWITYSPDSQMIILSTNYSGTHLLAVFQDTSQEIMVENAVTAATFSPDNHLLVIATADGYLRFFAQTSAEK